MNVAKGLKSKTRRPGVKRYICAVQGVDNPNLHLTCRLPNCTAEHFQSECNTVTIILS
jgi:hypothetical protein